MKKTYCSKNPILITFLLVLFTGGIAFSQSPKGKTTATKTTASKTPVNTKNIKARGIIAADMDCIVTVNAAKKTFNVKSGVATVVILNSGINTIEATSTDKAMVSTYKTSVTVKDTTKQIIEISFFDDRKFLDYIKQGMVSMVETAIKRNPDLANNEGEILLSNPLQIAITYSQPDIVKLLVNKGASFTKPDPIYPMHKAILFASNQKPKDKDQAPDKAMVDFFLTKGCKLTDKDDAGNTLLHAACRGVKLDMVQFLLDSGLDIDAKNEAGDTPLKIAENKGAVSIIEYLISKGAKQDKIEEPQEEEKTDSTQTEQKAEDK